MSLTAKATAIFIALTIPLVTTVAPTSVAAAPSDAVAGLTQALLGTINALPADSTEPTYEAQLAGDIEVANVSKDDAKAAIRGALSAITVSAPGVKPAVYKPAAAGKALLALLGRLLRARALGNGQGSGFDDPSFDDGSTGSNYTP